MKDRYTGLVILFAAALLYYWSYDQILDVGTTTSWITSPRFFPRFTLACMGLLACILIVQDLVGRGSTNKGKEIFISRQMVGLTAIAAGFVFSLKMFGYFISSPLLLLIIMISLGERSLKKIILITLITPALLYLFFDRFLDILLPSGELLDPWFNR